MPKSYEEIRARIQSKKIDPFYFICGDESYFIDQLALLLEKNSIAPSEKDFNFQVCYGKDYKLADILNIARQYPVFAERRLVLVKEAQDLSELSKDAGKKLLETYLDNPVPSTVLVFLYKNKEFNLKTKHAQKLDEKSVLVHAKKLYDNKVPDWILATAKEKGMLLQEKAAVLLMEYLGNELSRIAKELDKLHIHFTSKNEITDQHIKEFVGKNREYSVFDLQKAITQKDALLSYEIVKGFAANPKKNPLIPSLSLLHGFFCKVLLTHTSKDKTPQNLASKLKVHTFFVQDYLTASKKYSLSKTLDILEAIARADRQSKGIEPPQDEAAIWSELLQKFFL